MERTGKGIIFVVILFIVVYSIDSLFLRHLFWERLIVNIIIVLAAIAIYYLFLNK